MKVQDMEYFIAIAEKKSISKAAIDLYVAQPYLSRKLVDIEKEMGKRLVTRTTRSVELTKSGNIFLRHAKNIVREYYSAKREIAEKEESVTGTLRIGYNPIMGQPGYLLDTVRDMLHQYPSVKINMVRLYPTQMMEALENNQIDCCFLGQRYQKRFDDIGVIHLHTAVLMVYVSVLHPLAKRATLDIADLKGYPLVLLKREVAPVLHEITMKMTTLLDMSSLLLRYVSDIDEAKMMLSTGNFVAALSSDSLLGKDTEFVKIPISDFAEYDYRVLTWKTENKNMCLEIYKKIVKSYIEAE